MTVLIVVSTLAMGVGLFITWLVHSRSSLDIVVNPRTGQELSSIPGEVPLISVIIPARNEGRNIGRCLQALFKQTYPNIELIVIDDRSSDETPWHTITAGTSR